MGNYSIFRAVVYCVHSTRFPYMCLERERGVSADTVQLSISLLTNSTFSFTFCSAHGQLILWITTWALHFSSDIFIFILPLSILRTLRLGWKKKFGLYITFGFGVFSIGACLVRFLIVTTTYPEVPITNIEVWCALDSYVGLLVACLPSLRPYLNLKQETRVRLSATYDGRSWRVVDRSSMSNCSLTTPPQTYCG